MLDLLNFKKYLCFTATFLFAISVCILSSVPAWADTKINLEDVPAWADTKINLEDVPAPDFAFKAGDTLVLQGTIITDSGTDTNVSYMLFEKDDGKQPSSSKQLSEKPMPIVHYLSSGEEKSFEQKIVLNMNDFKKLFDCDYIGNGEYQIKIQVNGTVKAFPIKLELDIPVKANVSSPKEAVEKKDIKTTSATVKNSAKETSPKTVQEIKDGMIAPIHGGTDVALGIKESVKSPTMLSGTVYDVNNKPMANIPVELINGSHKDTYTTDKNGDYLFLKVFPGHYKMDIILAGHKTAPQNIEIMPNIQEKNIDFNVGLKNEVHLVSSQKPNVATTSPKQYELVGGEILIMVLTILGFYYFLFLPWQKRKSIFIKSKKEKILLTSWLAITIISTVSTIYMSQSVSKQTACIQPVAQQLEKKTTIATIAKTEEKDLTCRLFMPINGNGPGLKNALAGCHHLDGAVVSPNATLSFNQTVGQRLKDRGFVASRSYYNDNGKTITVPDIGGGVCRLSTLLHAAVKKSNLQVVERHSHTALVTYAKHGDDAAVAWPNVDYKFKNNRHDPIQIHTYFDNGSIVMELWSVS